MSRVILPRRELIVPNRNLQRGFINPYVFGGGGGPATTWNPSDKSALITLSAGNLTAEKTSTAGTWGSVRSTTAKSTGKWYFEVYVDAASGSGDDHFVGVMAGTDSITNYCGNGSGGYGYYGLNGNKYNSATPSAYGAGYTAAAVIGVAYDADAGKVWFAKNNTWQASGNPAAGTNPAFSGIPAGLYAAMSGVWIGTKMTARFASASQTYSPPSGFTAWG